MTTPHCIWFIIIYAGVWVSFDKAPCHQRMGRGRSSSGSIPTWTRWQQRTSYWDSLEALTLSAGCQGRNLKKHWCSRQLILSDQYNILCNLISTPPPLISVTRPHPLVMHWCSRWVAQWPPPLSSLTTPPRGRSSSTWAHTRSSHSLSSETSSSTTGTVRCTL